MDLELKEMLAAVQKPARYIGGEPGMITKTVSDMGARFAFCFPDLYEIGMSHLGMKILYGLLNSLPDVACERVFMPEKDMIEQMRLHGRTLWSLESMRPVKEFDIVGFTLQYEMSFVTTLKMLKLADIPLRSADRSESDPLLVAGGPCVCNPEPLAPFFDLFFLGEGEEQMAEFMAFFKEEKRKGTPRQELLRKAAAIGGVYVPSFYTPEYHEDGTIRAIRHEPFAPEKITRRIVKDMDKAYYPESFVVPFIEIVHDRTVAEVMRGCVRGCRFCQAGFIYRPLREKTPETINRQAKALCDNTGYDEISLASLSTSDLSGIVPLLEELIDWTKDEKINVALPSLRVDNFSKELLDKITSVRKSSLTFAPEAGTQRLRDAINKNVTDEDIDRTVRIAFEGGYTAIKLYFMLGLPTETDEDLKGIIDIAQRILGIFSHTENRPAGKGVTVTVSVSTFVPKPFTPFEFEPQITTEEIKRRQELLYSQNNSRKIVIKCHDKGTSYLEAVLARGDRRLADLLEMLADREDAFFETCEHPNEAAWEECFQALSVDPSFYAHRTRPYDEIMPWDHLDYGISKSFLIRENKRAHESKTTPDCRGGCAACGANRLKGGRCFD